MAYRKGCLWQISPNDQGCATMTMATTALISPADFNIRKFLPSRLTVLSNRLTRRAARFLTERFKLSASEWRTMAVLGQQGAMSVNAVIAQTAMDKVRVSRGVAKLLKAGLITRDADPRDRRHAILGLTAAGRELFEQIVPLIQDAEAELMAALTDGERTVLESALGKIEAAVR
jgi:DNA-binding MarR family transcriptional regulator